MVKKKLRQLSNLNLSLPHTDPSQDVSVTEELGLNVQYTGTLEESQLNLDDATGQCHLQLQSSKRGKSVPVTKWCSKYEVRRSSLTDWLRHKKLQRVNKLVKCIYCNKMFSCLHKYNQHLKTHLDALKKKLHK